MMMMMMMIMTMMMMMMKSTKHSKWNLRNLTLSILHIIIPVLQFDTTDAHTLLSKSK
jgi:hypothetical protein